MPNTTAKTISQYQIEKDPIVYPCCFDVFLLLKTWALIVVVAAWTQAACVNLRLAGRRRCFRRRCVSCGGSRRRRIVGASNSCQSAEHARDHHEPNEKHNEPTKEAHCCGAAEQDAADDEELDHQNHPSPVTLT